MDPHYPPLDDGCVAVPHIWHFAGRALGLRSSWLGRILGLGPRGKCFPAPVALDYGVPALCDDAGKTRHDEGMERVADLYHVHALDSGNPAPAQRHREFRALVRAVQYRQLV